MMRIAGILLILSVTLSGCTGSSNRAVAILATNLPHVVSYVEQFNGQSDTYKISVAYLEKPTGFDTEYPPDLIVGPGLEGAETIVLFADIGGIIESIGRDEFYRELLARGMFAENQLLIPLSFNLPILLTHISDSESFESESILEIDDMRRLSGDFSNETRLGFLPRMDSPTAYLFTRFFDVRFHETDQGVTAWNESLLRETVEYLYTWSDELNGGTENEESYARKYLFDPPYKLVADKRIRFAVSAIDEYLNVPAEIGEQLDIRWPAHDGLVYPDEDIVFIGRPKNSRNKKAATAFLTWLFRTETQSRLLEIERYRRVRGFGIAGGFSALKTINSDELVNIYPFLRGRMPAESNLRFPERLSSEWPIIRDEVIYPWLIEQSSRGTVSEPLGSVLLEWRRLRPNGG